MSDYAIAALTANGSYAFPQFFVLASEYVFHLVLETTMHPYFCGTPHVRKSPGVFIAHSLPLCNEVALC